MAVAWMLLGGNVMTGKVKYLGYVGYVGEGLGVGKNNLFFFFLIKGRFRKEGK